MPELNTLIDALGPMAKSLVSLRFSAGETLLSLLLLLLLSILFSGRHASRKLQTDFAKNVKTITDYVQGLEAGIRLLLKNEINAALHTALKNEDKSGKLDVSEIIAPLSRQADAHLKQSAEHRDEIGERIARANEERMNRVETRIESVSELVKEKVREGGGGGGVGIKEIEEAMHKKLEQHAMYLHDEFAAVVNKIDLFLSTQTDGEGKPVVAPAAVAAAAAPAADGQPQDSLLEILRRLDAKMDLRAKSADGESAPSPAFAGGESAELLQTVRQLDAKINLLAEGGGGKSSADGRLMEVLSQAIGRLGAEVNAKLSLLNDKMERQMENRWSDTLVSLTSLRERIEELAGAGERMESRRDISPFSPTMYAHAHEKDAALSEILAQSLPLENFAMDAELPGGFRVDALVRFPDPRDSIVIDAGFVPPPADPANEYGARRAFAEALSARIAHVADNLIAPPHTGENALMFISSEAVFAEIHSRHRDAVRTARARGIWLTSPSTLPAVVGTVNAAIRDHHAQRRLRDLRETVGQIVEEARHFENRLTEIGDHVNSAWRSVQRAESAGGRLIGGIRDISRAARDQEPPRFPAKHDSADSA